PPHIPGDNHGTPSWNTMAFTLSVSKPLPHITSAVASGLFPLSRPPLLTFVHLPFSDSLFLGVTELGLVGVVTF
ncbi:hypothetical protein A2U01_0085551, partial [Trifolium medium]|nr:hypothetical protein [Trifolium medium]